jgi:nitrite reductase/ring-hydroxylating ferredoxin subunit/uncharacterized membrane protein
MASEALAEVIGRQTGLSRVSSTLQGAVSRAFTAAGPAGREAKNFLHGTWLGHPLHPALTDIPIGAWTAALALDGLEAVTGRHEFAAGADASIAVGLAGAVGAAATGLTDWSATDGRARNIGLVHGLLNSGAALLYATSLAMRYRNERRTGVGLSLLGYTVAAAAAYLGGHMVYGERIGVDHAPVDSLPDDYVPVLPEADLHEGELKKVECQGVPVLLVRRQGEVFALAETCSHLGGPLSEGTLQGDVVQCPWHGSRFCIRDGSVVDGPATFPQPRIAVRVRDGIIEVRNGERGA